MLEQQQVQLIAGIQELYRRILQGQEWPCLVLGTEKQSQLSTHQLLQKLGILSDVWNEQEKLVPSRQPSVEAAEIRTVSHSPRSASQQDPLVFLGGPDLISETDPVGIDSLQSGSMEHFPLVADSCESLSRRRRVDLSLQLPLPFMFNPVADPFDAPLSYGNDESLRKMLDYEATGLQELAVAF